MTGPKNDKISLHPRVNIAFYWNELLVFVRVRKGRSSWRLYPVPLAVDLRHWMNIMGEGIAIGNLYVLPHVKRKHMRGVVAALLVEVHGSRGHRIVVRRTRGNIDNDILQRIAGTGNHLLGHKRLSMQLDTVRLLGHVNGLGFRWSSRIGHTSNYGPAAGGGRENGWNQQNG